MSLKPSSTFWLAITLAFRASDQHLQETGEKEEVVRILTSQEVSTRNPFPFKTAPKDSSGDETVDLEAWIENIRDAMDVDDIVLKVYLESMKVKWDKMQAIEKQWVARDFLPGAMDRLSDAASGFMPPRLPGDKALASFWLLAITCYLENYDENSSKLLTALRWYGDYESSKET